MRLSIDVGGTFTDILLTSSGGKAAAFKASTTYPDPIEAIVAGLQLAAASRGFSVETLLGETESLFHSTTRAINAVVTGNVARTGLLVTQGHPDILLIREGGRTDPSTTTYLMRRAIFHARSLSRFRSAWAQTAASSRRLMKQQRCG
jgi:N-methylhydantoinase A